LKNLPHLFENFDIEENFHEIIKEM